VTDYIDTTPKPAFLRALQNQKWTVAGALSELIDNSLGTGRGAAKHVVITHDPKQRVITVLDDGRGMDAVGRLFQLGNTIGRSPGDIGLYGSGGTMAIVWLPARVEVFTMRNGMMSAVSAVWEDVFKMAAFPKVPNRWTKATLANTPESLYALGHGTLIRLHLLNERRFTGNNVQRDLAANHGPIMRAGKEILWRTLGRGGGEHVLAELMPEFTDSKKVVHIDLILQLPNGAELPVTGTIGWVEDLPQSKSVISVGFGTRVVMKTRDCYAAPDGSKSYLGIGITGWLDLGEGWQPYLTTTKDAMNDQPAWERLMGHVFQEIESLLKAVDHQGFSLLFDEIGIHLEAALNTHTPFEIGVKAKPSPQPEPDPGPAPGPGPGPDDPKHHNKPRVPMDDPGDDIKIPEPGVTKLAVIETSDADLEGLLCKCEKIGQHEIMVSVNSDHSVVKEALQKRPINRMALNLLITREIADMVAEDDALRRVMFRPGVLREIEARDEDMRPAFIARLLMDRARIERDAA